VAASGSIRLSRFWARRARRLLPALLLLFVVVLLYTRFALPPGTDQGIRLDALSAPFMAWLYSPAGVNRVYYGTDTRAQSLLVGAALATVFRMVAERRQSAGADGRGSDAATSTADAWSSSASDQRHRMLASAAGVVGVLVTVALWTWVSVDNAFAFRGGFLVAALATAAVLANIVVAPRSLVPRCLAVLPLRALGRISYGLYLWHFPLFLWLDESGTGLGGFELFALKFVCTVVVATLSYYLVELPIRQRRFLKSWSAWVVTPIGATGDRCGRFGQLLPLRT
jgi:peptidoglycan/LPS O-acetylase OafA/YrhL